MYFFIVSGIIVIVLAQHVRCFCPADSQSMPFEVVSLYLQFSLSTAALDVLHRTRSSANSMARGDCVSFSEASTSMMMMKWRGLLLISDAGPRSHQNTLYFLPLSLPGFDSPQPSGTLVFRRLHHISSLGNRSYAFSRSTKSTLSSFSLFRYFSCSILNAKIGSVVDLPGLNPNFFCNHSCLSQSGFYQSFPWLHIMAHQFDNSVVVAIQYITHAFEYRYHHAISPVI